MKTYALLLVLALMAGGCASTRWTHPTISDPRLVAIDEKHCEKVAAGIAFVETGYSSKYHYTNSSRDASIGDAVKSGLIQGIEQVRCMRGLGYR